MDKKYNSIFISDTHLGSKDSRAKDLDDFLKENSCNNLYLIGDIIDGWKIQRKKWRWKQSHTNVVRRILKKANEDTNVIYIAGNHDEFLRPLLHYDIGFGRIKVVNSYIHFGIDGKQYLVVHGDMFDGITRLAPWISFLGDRSYDFVLNLNSKFNWLRHRLGFGYWSLSKFLKYRVKKAVDFMFKYENNITNYAKKRGFDGVICGHIHHAEIKIVNDVIYMNDGDWVESCTALVEHHDGTWEIIEWLKHTSS